MKAILAGMYRFAQLRHFASAVVVFAALTGCQTPREKEFDAVKVGMAKDQVLNAAGNPTVSRRWKGMDRWIYFYPSADTSKEVHFLEGKVVYAGGAYQPPVSASEQDRLNDEANIAEAKRVKALEQEIDRVREEFHNPTTTPKEESAKVAPNWVPVQ
jgi:outer membrane protein assembly factor BamE (lipoprotein component of BamABCDE complex)